MFLILDERQTVSDAYVRCFDREGVAAAGMTMAELPDWLDGACDTDVAAIEGFLVGSGENRRVLPTRIRARSKAPLIGIIDGRALPEMLELFSAGVDDVVAKPFHVREILARMSAIARRQRHVDESVEVNGIRVFFDGRDPVVAGEVLSLPRRERRILEYLVSGRCVRVTKTQIFNRVYGIFNDDIHENVIESHISRLRKRLRLRLGYDPIESQRYLGYRIVDQAAPRVSDSGSKTSFTQGRDGFLLEEANLIEEAGNGSVRNYDDERVGYVCTG
ncbi:MAG: winged helix-turn-helix domain-containing protein [Hyphomicrobium sp.]|nr:winged helix-turn-helix domain-containing protein [Hyphomicrobium sp.]